VMAAVSYIASATKTFLSMSNSNDSPLSSQDVFKTST